MKVTHKTKSIITIIIVALCSTNTLFSIISIPNASAESFQSSQTVYFTFKPTISITTSGDLVIESLTPGDYKDSNIITVTASSNAVAGYSLTSAVGTSTNTSNELRKDGTDTINIFSNLTANQSALSNFSDNTWGYSYSLDSGSTWISGSTGDTATGYNGYTYDTTTSTSETITHLSSTTSGSSSIQYKIGAKASTTQIAGEYTNVINFIGVANNNPEIIYMQDATMADCGKTMVDSRDNNVYSTTNVEGTCWMTTNLNLAGGTVLSSNDTDFTSDYYPNLPNDNGWTVVGDNKLKMPSSSTEGFSENNYAYVYNTGNISSNCASPGCYSYYSWDTATLGSGRNITTGNTDAPYSICPKGWRLPNTRNSNDDSSDFRKLMIALGGSSEISIYNTNTNPTGAEIFNNLSDNPLNFLRSGEYFDSLPHYNNNLGSYWSSTSVNSFAPSAAYLNFNSTYINSYNYFYRKGGYAIRCVKSS